MNEHVLTEFIQAACVPLDAAHASGTLDRAQAILKANPALAGSDLRVAAILGEAAAVRRFIAADRGSASKKGEPYGWDSLTYLCFSKYLRLDRRRSAGFLEAARALLDAGASARTGFFAEDHLPNPQFESVLYGAAGVAHDAELTRLLIERGADPNDEEVAYHTPETYDNAALQVLVESGKLAEDRLATMLLRKTDWHDREGVKYLLEHGADPNQLTHWGKTALHNALLSDNVLGIVELLLDHGADPAIQGTHPEVCRSASGKSAVALAARRGRADVLNAFKRRGLAIALEGVESLMAACARGDRAVIDSFRDQRPEIVRALRAEAGKVLAEFAGNGNTEGLQQLLDLGVDVDARHEEGDSYFCVATKSTALHVAAWRARHGTVRFLLARGAQVNAKDSEGQTPLALAVRACVDSYWSESRSPESVQALLQAGASVDGVGFPSGYQEVDELLRAHGAQPTKSQC